MPYKPQEPCKRLLLCPIGSLRSPYSMHSSIAWWGLFFFRIRRPVWFVWAAVHPRLGVRFAPPRLWCRGVVLRLLSLWCARSSCSGSRRLATCAPLGLTLAGVSDALGYRRRLGTSRGLRGFGALVVFTWHSGWLVSVGRVASSHAPPVWLVSGLAC